MSSHLKTLVVFSLLVIAPAGLRAQTSVWKADNFQVRNVEAVIADSQGSADFLLTPPTGVSVGPAPDGGHQKKSVVFDGTQVAFRTAQGFPSAVESLEVNFTFQPGEVPDEMERTVLRYATQWEIRHVPKLGALSFIVWHTSGTYTTVAVPLKTGLWHEVKAKVTKDTISIEAEGEQDQKPMESPLVSEARDVALLLGGSRPTPGPDGQGGRQLIGAIGEITVTVD